MTNKHNKHTNKNTSIEFSNLAKYAVDSLTTSIDKLRPRIGDKCKLNIERITNRKEWANLNPKYKQFVLDNKNTVFTVQADNYKPKSDGFVAIVAFAEDTTDPKWLWSVDDLIKIED